MWSFPPSLPSVHWSDAVIPTVVGTEMSWDSVRDKLKKHVVRIIIGEFNACGVPVLRFLRQSMNVNVAAYRVAPLFRLGRQIEGLSGMVLCLGPFGQFSPFPYETYIRPLQVPTTVDYDTDVTKHWPLFPYIQQKVITLRPLIIASSQTAQLINN